MTSPSSIDSNRAQIFIGCAGWSIRKEQVGFFPEPGSHLERYSSVFNCVEINSSFKSFHQRKTYERWSKSVPEHFRFAVKFPKIISHTKALQNCEEEIGSFLHSVGGLGDKCGPLLLQLPPSAGFDRAIAEVFFSNLTKQTQQQIVIEPRHRTWFESVAIDLCAGFHISVVTADPKPFPGAPQASSSYYFRLHGSPKMYYSEYSSEYISEVATLALQRSAARSPWVIFDNTALGSATINALDLKKLLEVERQERSGKSSASKVAQP